MTSRRLAPRSPQELTGTGEEVSTRPRTHRVALLLALWSGTGWLLLRLGGGALGVPLGSTKALSAWLDGADPTVMAAATVRLVALALCAYLTAATALVLLASLARWRPATASAGRLLPSVLRRLLVGTAGAGLTSSIVSSAVSPAVVIAAPDQGEDRADRTAVMVKLEPENPSTTSSAPARPSTLPTSSTTTTSPTTTTTAAATSSTTTSGTGPREPSAGSGPVLGQADGEAPTARTTDTNASSWIVQPGDSFWSIAEEIVTEQLPPSGSSSPTDADIGRYWRALIEANRDRLADRKNPDLLFSGQELELPRLR